MIILDTSLLFANFNSEDENNHIAQLIFQRIFKGEYAQPVLIDYVYDELLTLIYYRTRNFDNCKSISRILQYFINLNRIVLIHTPSEVFWKANEVFLGQDIENQRRFLSFTDCIIGVIASWLNATHIGTFDAQFHQFPIEIVSQ